MALPHFRYRASYLGVAENEICPVFIGWCQAEPQPNLLEVAATLWIDWQSFLSQETASARFEDTAYSP